MGNSRSLPHSFGLPSWMWSVTMKCQTTPFMCLKLSVNFRGSVKDQINNRATRTFYNWHTYCSENHLNGLTLKTHERVTCSYQTWKCEKVFIYIFRWQTFTYSVYKQMLAKMEGEGWQGCDGNDEILARISHLQPHSLEESL